MTNKSNIQISRINGTYSDYFYEYSAAELGVTHDVGIKIEGVKVRLKEPAVWCYDFSYARESYKKYIKKVDKMTGRNMI